ncbi:MAG: ATP-binding protein [Bacilli bacterium]
MKKATEFNNFDVDSVNEILMKKFSDKMMDSKFFTYANSLKHKDCYLYISEIEHAILEHSNCSDCKSLTSCKNLIKGHCYDLKNDNNNIVEYYVVCSKLKEVEYLKNILFFGENKEENDIKVHSEFYRDDVRKDVIEYINTIIEENDISKKGIYLSGSFGTGKSYIMSLLTKKLAQNGYKCGFVYFPELLVELKKEFNENSQSLLDKIKVLDVLIIDDIGSEKVSEWSRDEVLGTILQYRMDNNLFTCFTSNYTLKELLKHYNKDKELIKANRIIDRINFLTTSFKLIGKNYRNEKSL